MITNSIIVIILLPLFHKQTNTGACISLTQRLPLRYNERPYSQCVIRKVKKIDVKWCEVWDEK